MSGMFYGCTNLRTIYAGSGWTTSAVTSSMSMFRYCTNLVGGQGTTFDANHTDKAYARFDGGPSNPGYFTEMKEAYACYTPSDKMMVFYYDSQRYMRPGDNYDLNTGSEYPGWFLDVNYFNGCKYVIFDQSFANYRPTSTAAWFMYMEQLESIGGIQNLTTSSVTYMDHMFYNCTGLTDLYCYAEKVPTTGSGVFRDAPVSSATLHVPAASIDAYKAADPWKAFGTIVALTPEETGVESITATEKPSDRKFMENGRLIIQKNGQRYNVAGQMVKEK